MFTGEFVRNLDQKGRIAFPKELLSQLKEAEVEKCMLTKGFDNPCLCIFPYKDWLRFVESLTSFSFTDQEQQATLRFVGSGALECKFDNTGRILLPENLRTFARLTSEIVVIGTITRIEIWDKNRWQNYTWEASGIFDETERMLQEVIRDKSKLVSKNK